MAAPNAFANGEIDRAELDRRLCADLQTAQRREVGASDSPRASTTLCSGTTATSSPVASESCRPSLHIVAEAKAPAYLGAFLLCRLRLRFGCTRRPYRRFALRHCKRLARAPYWRRWARRQAGV